MKRFSEKYGSFRVWRKAMPRDTRYAKHIISLHKMFPGKNLLELRNTKQSDYLFSAKDWADLTSKQKNERVLSLEVLRALRKKESFSETLSRVGIGKDVLLKNIGKFLKKKGKRWTPSKRDNISVEMQIYEKDVGIASIITKSSKDRSIIGQYFSDVQKAMEHNNSAILKKYKRLVIKDSKGVEHRLETDLDAVYRIDESLEDNDGPMPYGG